MDQEPVRTPASGEASGLRGLAHAGLLYFEARSRLLQIEAQEAGGHLTRLTVLAVMAAGLFGGAWLLLVPVVVWWIAHLSGWPWHCVAGVLAATHLFLGVLLVARLKSAASRLKLFEETINQCRKDRECLGGSTHDGN